MSWSPGYLRVRNSVQQWGAESSLARQWLPVAGGDWAWAARMGLGLIQVCGDIFLAILLWRSSLLTTGHLSSSHLVVMGAGHVLWGLQLQD